MAFLVKGIIKLYYYMNEELSDPRTQNWPLMRTPWPGLCILALYLLTVLKWLPKYMENRPAYNIRKILLVFNCLQVIACAYVMYQSLKLGWLNNYSFVCQGLDEGPEALEYAWKVCYIYFCIKVADLLDTIFFVLRKKQNQVSFLHVYHHSGMGCLSWAIVKWVPGGHGSLLVPVNSFVHIVMYSYYMLTTWSDSKKGLWWKKYVTQIQITQFAFLLVHFSTLFFVRDCPFPSVTGFILVPQNLFMLTLFSEFYYRTYIKQDKTHKNE